MNTFFFRLLLLIEVFYFSAAHCQTSIESNIGKAEEMSFQSNEIIRFLRKPLQDSLHLVSQHSKYGMIDSTGGIVVPMIYDQINVNFTFRELLLWERKYLLENELFYFFWEDGNESVELYNTLLKQEMANPTSPYNLELVFRTKPFFAARKENLWGVINAKNEILIPFEYNLIEEIGQNILLAKQNHSFEILTPDNKKMVESCDTIIVSPITKFHVELGSEFAAYAILIRDNKYGAINLQNLAIAQPKYDSLEYCSIPTIEDEWMCAFNPNDIRQPITHEKFNRTHTYKNVVRYKLNNKVGLLDMRCMEEITLVSFDSIRISNNWRTRGQIVQLDNRYTFLTHNNTRLHDRLYDSVRELTSDDWYYKVYLNGKAGVYNDIGQKVLNLKWEDIQFLFTRYNSPSSYFIVKRNGKFGVVDSREKKIISARYDSITYKYEDSRHFLELRRKEELEKIYTEDL
jgi:hypothetical protein